MVEQRAVDKTVTNTQVPLNAGIARLSEELSASQEELCSMDSVIAEGELPLLPSVYQHVGTQ
jgi:hypothetical protein